MKPVTVKFSTVFSRNFVFSPECSSSNNLNLYWRKIPSVPQLVVFVFSICNKFLHAKLCYI
jgi:hypothetical protein